MSPWFAATERFGPHLKDAWSKYVEWSGLNQLDEVVSLDAMLNPPLLAEMKAEYWPYFPSGCRMFGLFTDLAFLLGQVPQSSKRNILCVFLNPIEPPKLPQDLARFELLGYDLVEVEGSTSALTNCGGFPGVFSNGELSSKGLLVSHVRAQEVQAKLRASHPEEHHADCDLWAIARAVEL